MKNLKVYKRVLAILTASTLVLMSSCSKSNKEPKKEEPKACKHLVVYFEDQPITFKECEGYSFGTTALYGYNSDLEYSIYKDGKNIIYDGSTNQFNFYEVYHEYADEIIDNESVQKAK